MSQASPFPLSAPEASPSSEAAYREAGVDLNAARDVVDLAKQAAAPTLRKDIKFGGIGGFSGAFCIPEGYKRPVILAGCDGVGTKLALALQMQQHHTVGIDLVAMCVNDLLAQGAEPLVFLDYMATGKLETEHLQAVLAGISEGCIQAGCVLAGGETAEMPGFYEASKYDLAGFSVGVAEADELYPKQGTLAAGDILIGLASSGLHSNGFSLVRKLLADHGQVDLKAPFLPGERSIGEALLEPTRIYVKPVLELLKTYPAAVKAMVHNTGGGFIDNLPRALPPELQAHIAPEAWPWHPVYKYLFSLSSLPLATWLHTFNCGIGYILCVKPEAAEQVLAFFNTGAGQSAGAAYTIGHLQALPQVNAPQVVWDIALKAEALLS